MKLTKLEQETIITLNKEEKEASVFTYDVIWQRHLEKKLGLVPVMKNSHGGREYYIDKKRIKMPRAPRQVKNSCFKKSSISK